MSKQSGTPLKVASALATLTAGIHFFAGGPGALDPMLEASLPPVAAGAMHACWHIVTLFLVASVPIFWIGGKTASVFGLLWMLSAVIFIYVGLFQGGAGGLATNLQWTILGATGAVAIIGVRQSSKNQSR